MNVTCYAKFNTCNLDDDQRNFRLMLTFVVIVCTGENEGRTGERTSGIGGKFNYLQYKCTYHKAFIFESISQIYLEPCFILR